MCRLDSTPPAGLGRRKALRPSRCSAAEGAVSCVPRPPRGCWRCVARTKDRVVTTDFIALLDCPRGPNVLEAVRCFVVQHPDATADFVTRYGAKWRPKEWTRGSTRASAHPELVGPGGFSLSFRPTSLELYHMMRFQTFTDEEAIQTRLRRLCWHVARIVESDRAVYTHEMMPYGEGTLGEMIANLATAIGPPSRTLPDMRGAKLYEPGAWYVDDFADLQLDAGGWDAAQQEATD